MCERLLGLLGFLAQVVSLHVLPESLRHLRGRDLLSLPATQHGSKVFVELNPVSPERTSLVCRQAHLLGPSSGAS